VLVAGAKDFGIAGHSRRADSGRILVQAIELSPVVAAARATVDSDRSVEEIVEHTRVEPTSASGFVRIAVTETSEQRAVALANAIAVQAMDLLRRVAATHRVIPARATEELDASGATVAWALRGALVGLAVALVAIAMGVAAHRREES
jgi:capsular polysaccharide biosynthesis protein